METTERRFTIALVRASNIKKTDVEEVCDDNRDAQLKKKRKTKENVLGNILNRDAAEQARGLMSCQMRANKVRVPAYSGKVSRKLSQKCPRNVAEHGSIHIKLRQHSGLSSRRQWRKSF